MTSDTGSRTSASAQQTRDDALDAAARRAHAASLERLSPRVRAQLTLRGRDALSGAHAKPRARWWPGLAAGSVAVLALAVGLRLQPPPDTPPKSARPAVAATTTGSGPDEALPPADIPTDFEALDENPDFYLWLASDEAGALTEDTP